MKRATIEVDVKDERWSRLVLTQWNDPEERAKIDGTHGRVTALVALATLHGYTITRYTRSEAAGLRMIVV